MVAEPVTRTTREPTLKRILLGLILYMLACDAPAGSTPPVQDIASPEDTALPQDTAPPQDTNPPGEDTAVDAADSEPLAPVCERSPERIRCPHETLNILVGFESRGLHYALPAGEPPPEGWPVVIFFQGSFLSASIAWEAYPLSTYGLYYRVEAAADLLDAGFAVLAPEAQIGGTTFWNTNIAPWNLAWTTSPDHLFMLDIFAAIEDGSLGALDANRLHAAGISSGGYMTSRMALSYPGRFRSLAIHSASWATCDGVLCFVPGSLPEDHPPTLFLHGALDPIVPITTMWAYHDALQAQGIDVAAEVDPSAAHAWIAATPQALVSWFQR